MSRGGRALCVAHGLAFLWLAYCGVLQARYGSAWAVALFVAASLTQLAAALRESDRADRRRITAAASRRRPGGSSAAEDEAALGLLYGCCDLWWTSAGATHEAGCSGAIAGGRST